MDIIISNSNGKPIYEQITSQIKSLIMNGELKEGDALPSMRLLAKELHISVITTKRAYEELEKEGLIRSVAGKGFYVCEYNTDYLKEYNSLEINLPKYYEGLQMEMEGNFEEAKELYKQNGLNYDYMRVEKLNKEILNQINEDSILEFNDIKIDKDS